MTNEADILATTYWHTCTIIRPQATEFRGWDDFDDVAVYTDLPCAVSFSAVPTGGQTDTTQAVEYIATLFVRPEIDVQAGDKIVANVQGKIYEFLANEPLLYPSHIKVPLIRRDRA